MEAGGHRNGDGGDGTGDLFDESREADANQPVAVRGTAFRGAGKYAALARHLEGVEEATCELQFTRLEEIIGSDLPGSARRRRTGWLWWTNDPYQTQAKNGWLAAGWVVSNVDYVKSVALLRRPSR